MAEDGSLRPPNDRRCLGPWETVKALYNAGAGFTSVPYEAPAGLKTCPTSLVSVAQFLLRRGWGTCWFYERVLRCPGRSEDLPYEAPGRCEDLPYEALGGSWDEIRSMWQFVKT